MLFINFKNFNFDFSSCIDWQARCFGAYKNLFGCSAGSAIQSTTTTTISNCTIFINNKYFCDFKFETTATATATATATVYSIVIVYHRYSIFIFINIKNTKIKNIDFSIYIMQIFLLKEIYIIKYRKI